MRVLLLLLLWAGGARAQGHSVVFVVLSGFRWDYAAKYGAVNLLAMARGGASAPEGMLPAYPAESCPNLQTLATGFYPEHHGIIADGPHCTDHAAARPITTLWALAERNGIEAACVGWVGCESASLLEDAATDATRTERALALLRQATAAKPRLIALALNGVDRAGRVYGPDSPQTRAAVKGTDALLGRLRAGSAGSKLPVDLIVVSDRGLAKTDGGWINLDAYTDLSGFKTDGSLLYAPNEAEAQRAYEQLKIADARFKVYRRKDLPRGLHFNADPSAGDPVVVATGPFAIRAHAAPGEPDAGIDGLDPVQVPEMKAVFYSEGPDIRAGVKLRTFASVNVFPFLAGLLGLPSPKVDGSAGVLSSASTR